MGTSSTDVITLQKVSPRQRLGLFSIFTFQPGQDRRRVGPLMVRLLTNDNEFSMMVHLLDIPGSLYLRHGGPKDGTAKQRPMPLEILDEISEQ